MLGTGDGGSKALFQEILAREEAHIGWLKTQIDLVDRLGLPSHLQSQL
ncbi:MAG: hypothetical protein ACYC18_00310 [Gammaproteobacteria bacterium]